MVISGVWAARQLGNKQAGSYYRHEHEYLNSIPTTHIKNSKVVQSYESRDKEVRLVGHQLGLIGKPWVPVRDSPFTHKVVASNDSRVLI